MVGRVRGLATTLAAGTIALAGLAPVVALVPAVPPAVRGGPAGASGQVARAVAVPPVDHPARIGSGPLHRSVPATGRWAAADTAAIRPGVPTETAGAGRCTSNFVFTADGRSFLGQAAHCAGTGLATETDGCTSGTRSLGTPVRLLARDGSRRTGTLAYSSWITMQQRREADPATCAYNDFALVELAPGDAAQVNPSLPVLGGPTGLRRGGLPAGAPVFGYGGAAAPRPFASAGDVGAGFGHEFYAASPGAPGESGSAFVDGDGAAVGVLTTLNLSANPVSNGATDLAAALVYASTYSGLGEIRLVPGTEPFSTAPFSTAPFSTAPVRTAPVRTAPVRTAPVR